MSALLTRRVGWCSGVGARLFAGVPPMGMPAAWRELQRDPAALSAARWAALMNMAAGDATGESGMEAGSRAAQADQAAVRAMKAISPSGLGAWAPAPAQAWAEQGRGEGGVSARRRPHPLVPQVGEGATAISVHARDHEAIWPARWHLPAGLWPESADTSWGALSTQPAWTSEATAAARPSAALGAPGRAAMPVPVREQTVAHAKLLVAPATQAQDAAILPAAAASTRLVQSASGLGRLLALVPRHRPAAEQAATPQDAQIAPRAAPPTSNPINASGAGPATAAGTAPAWQPAAQTPQHCAAQANPAPDVDTLLDALVERLRVEYLRHYGSAG